MADTDEDLSIPENAVYMGTDMGGEFVAIERRDIVLDGKITLPAYTMQIYAAFSDGKNYGVDRIGQKIFSGLGLYVPPEIELSSGSAPYEAPSAEFVLQNGWVNSDVLHVRLKPVEDDPEGLYIGKIIPVNLPPAE